MKCARRNCRRPTRRLAKAMTVLTSVQGRSECPPLYARRNQPLSSPWFPCKIAHVRARRAVTDMKLPLRASMRQRRLDGDGPSCPLNESGCAKPRFVVKRPLVYTDIAPISAQQRQPHRPQAGHTHRRPVRQGADTPCVTITPHTAVSSGAASAARNHTSTPKQPVSPPRPIASLTSPAPIAAGKARCTSRYTPAKAAAPASAGTPRPARPAKSRITPRPGQGEPVG